MKDSMFETLFLFCAYRCCNSDGLILKPDKPATAIDAQIHQVSNHYIGPTLSPFDLINTYFNEIKESYVCPTRSS